ncbi:MAG: hypothetical protein WCF12_10515 [Propionicimonas sp.]
MVKVTSARIVATAGVVIYWVGMFLAGALAPSYSALHDFMSSLASRGSSVATLGVASLLVLAVTHAAAGFVLLRASTGSG